MGRDGIPKKLSNIGPANDTKRGENTLLALCLTDALIGSQEGGRGGEREVIELGLNPNRIHLSR